MSNLSDSEINKKVVEHAEMVHKLASSMIKDLTSNVDINDLRQAGMIGLFEAVKNYDENSETKFVSFAYHRIRGSMYDELRKMDWLSRVSRDHKKAAVKAYNNLLNTLHRKPTVGEISAEMNISVERYNEINSNVSSIQIFSMHRDDGDDTWIDPELEAIADDGTDTLMICEERDAYQKLHHAIKHLSDEEKELIRLRFEENMGIKRIAELHSTYEQKVAKQFNDLFLKLRQQLTGLSFK